MILIFADILADSAEGMAQRVHRIDAELKSHERTYIKWDNRKWKTFGGSAFTVDSLCTQYTLSARQPAHWFLLAVLILRTKAMYFHSVYSAASLLGRIALRVPKKLKIWDAHGAVPEENKLFGFEKTFGYYSELEACFAQRASVVITVTEAMAVHINNKYPNLKARFILLPMPQNIDPQLEPIPREDYAIYSGGAQKWQSIGLLIDLVKLKPAKMNVGIFTQDLNIFSRILRDADLTETTRLAKLSSAELATEYRSAKFGFILRDDSIVNRVSSPTKLFEYLIYGLIPIVDSPAIGDYQQLGYQYVAAEDFRRHELPDDSNLLLMREENRKVLAAIFAQQQAGLSKLTALFA